MKARVETVQAKDARRQGHAGHAEDEEDRYPELKDAYEAGR
jgi:hypothetical protein